MTNSIAPQRVVVLLTSVALALVLLFVLSVTVFAGTADAGAEQVTVEHRVVAGDTLWDIAVHAAAPGSDVRNTVEDIKRMNGLSTSLITPGQVLVVPAGD